MIGEARAGRRGPDGFGSSSSASRQPSGTLARMPRLVRRAALILGSLSPGLLLPAAAAAQAPPPAGGAMSIKLERVVHAGHDDVALRGDRVNVRGTVAPYVAGQTVRVRVYRGGKRVATKAAAVQPVAGSTNGGFVVSLRPPTGCLTVRASHRATAAQASMAAKARRVMVLVPRAAPGARGPIVRLLQ